MPYNARAECQPNCFQIFCFNILGLGTQATMTNLTAELETDAEIFLTSVNENKSQLQISFKCRRSSLLPRSRSFYVFRFWTESCLSLIADKFIDMFVKVLVQIHSVYFVFETLRNKSLESKFSCRRCRVRTCLR